MPSIQITVTDEVYRRIKQAAAKRGLAVTAFGRIALSHECRDTGIELDYTAPKRGRPRKSAQVNEESKS